MIPLRSLQRSAFGTLNSVIEPLARTVWTGPLPVGAGLVLLETTGRRSGRPRANPLLSLRLGDTVMAGTVRPASDWVANLRATPRPRIWLDGAAVDVAASVMKLPLGSVATFRSHT